MWLVVSSGEALSCELLFSHSMPLGIGYSFRGFVDAIKCEVSGIWFHLFLSYPMLPAVWDWACGEGRGFSITVDEGISGRF